MEIIAKSMTSKVTMFYSAYSRIFLILLQLGFNDKPVTKRSVTVPCATGPSLDSYLWLSPKEQDASRMM